MKRKLILTIAMASALSLAGLTACANPSSGAGMSGNEAENISESSDAVSSSDNSVINVKGEPVEEYTGVVASYEADEYYSVACEEVCKLEIFEGDTCTITDSYVMENYCYSSEYTGTFKAEVNEDGSKSYKVDAFDGWDVVTYTVVVDENGTVISLYAYNSGSNSTADYTEILGSYENDTEIGKISFEVTEEGVSTVFVDDVEANYANLYLYDQDGEDGDRFEPQWDLCFDLGEESYDWYVYFNGDTFTYEPYLEAVYKECEGTYDMDGELGKISVKVDNRGSASATVTIDGTAYEMNGSISYDFNNEVLTDVNLYDEASGYSVSLYVEDKDGELWYTGNVSIYKELNAG